MEGNQIAHFLWSGVWRDLEVAIMSAFLSSRFLCLYILCTITTLIFSYLATNVIGKYMNSYPCTYKTWNTQYYVHSYVDTGEQLYLAQEVFMWTWLRTVHSNVQCCLVHDNYHVLITSRPANYTNVCSASYCMTATVRVVRGQLPKPHGIQTYYYCVLTCASTKEC